MFLKILPARLKTKTESVCKRQRRACEEDIALAGGRVYGDYPLAALTNYDEKDRDRCRQTNLERLVRSARTRLHAWYSD